MLDKITLAIKIILLVVLNCFNGSRCLYLLLKIVYMHGGQVGGYIVQQLSHRGRRD